MRCMRYSEDVFGIFGCTFSICVNGHFVAVGVFLGLVLVSGGFVSGTFWCVFRTLVVHFVNVRSFFTGD